MKNLRVTLQSSTTKSQQHTNTQSQDKCLPQVLFNFFDEKESEWFLRNKSGRFYNSEKLWKQKFGRAKSQKEYAPSENWKGRNFRSNSGRNHWQKNWRWLKQYFPQSGLSLRLKQIFKLWETLCKQILGRSKITKGIQTRQNFKTIPENREKNST